MFKVEVNYQVKVKRLPQGLFKNAGRKLVKFLKLKKSFNLSVALVSPQAIRRLNKKYRGQDQVTDVLSFAKVNEIVICYQQAKKQAQERRQTVPKEMSFLFIHGFLHLLGYDDRTASGASKMNEITRRVTE